MGTTHLTRFLRAAADLLLPPSCLTCDAPVEVVGQFCAACFAATVFITAPFCRRCGVPFEHAGQGGVEQLCFGCDETPPDFGRARGLLRYDAQVKRVVLPLKYADRTDIAAALGRQMARAGAALLREAELLVPVPLHRGRLAARRYNQAALLARAVGRAARRKVLPDALVRLRATAALGERSAAERLAILDGAIAVRPRRETAIAGRRVLLIDDVMTSGATANACARALKSAGALVVDVLALARVPDPRLG